MCVCGGGGGGTGLVGIDIRAGEDWKAIKDVTIERCSRPKNHISMLINTGSLPGSL